jgi:hypothetical protein
MRTTYLAHMDMRCTPYCIEPRADVHDVRASRLRLFAVMHSLPYLASGACVLQHVAFGDDSQDVSRSHTA